MPPNVNKDVRTPLARVANFLAGTGSGLAAIIGTIAVLGWVIVGAATSFTPEWAIALHTVAAGVTLVMVFVLQYVSHRQSRAVLLKLDELLRISEAARESVIAVEHAPVHEQERLEDQMRTHRP
jgi:low affinity Fe/Cu permease